jgi:hypothetical protein
MRIFLIAVAVILALGACAPPQSSAAGDPPRDQSTSPDGPSVADAKACSDRGGTWRRVCLMGTWSCVMPYSDGGKSCKDKKDCQGQCRYQGEGVLEPGSPVTGVCQRNSDPCGCFAEVRDGKLQPTLCVD